MAKRDIDCTVECLEYQRETNKSFCTSRCEDHRRDHERMRKLTAAILEKCLNGEYQL